MPNKGTDIELSRKYGLSDEQIEAMQGMDSILPRTSIWRFRKKTPEQITQSVQNYAPAFVAYTAAFSEVLHNPGLRERFNEGYIKLIRNSIKADLKIAIQLDDEELLMKAFEDITTLFDTSQNPDKQVEMLLSKRSSDQSTQSSIPPPPHLDSSI